jgi:O-succinylbenzoate synthase
MITVPRVSVEASPSDAKLALRLGMAVNALRAQQRATIRMGNEPTTVGEHDRLMAFMLTLAYLHETRVLVQRNFSRVRTWAIDGGATPELHESIASLNSGSNSFGRSIATARNKAVFHWDEDLLDAWFAQIQVEGLDSIVWAEGADGSNGSMVMLASAQAALVGLLGVSSGAESPLRSLRELSLQLAIYVDHVCNYLNYALAAFLRANQGEVTTRVERP